jgi:DNA-directed RNA polymerase subunit H (RpoH/RPB5)
MSTAVNPSAEISALHEVISPSASNLARTRIHVARMLQKRGYTVPVPVRTPVQKVEDITGKKSTAWEDLNFVASRHKFVSSAERRDATECTCEHIAVIFWIGPFGVDTLKPLVDEILWDRLNNSTQFKQLLVVHCMEHTNNPMASDCVRQTLSRTVYNNIPIDIFPQSYFQQDLIEHVLTPCYKDVTDEYDEETMQGPKENLPKLFADDPMARYWGFSPGTVVRVQYPDPTIHT